MTTDPFEGETGKSKSQEWLEVDIHEVRTAAKLFVVDAERDVANNDESWGEQKESSDMNTVQ